LVYGYCRCSTNETKQDVNRQRRELQDMGITSDKVFMEYESGTKVNRPELMKLLNAVQTGDIIASDYSIPDCCKRCSFGTGFIYFCA